MKLATTVLACGLLLFAQGVHAGQPQYFGYYANSGNTADNGDHTNITFIQTYSIPNQQDAINLIFSELAQAKARNLKAVIDVHKLLFTTGANDSCPYKPNPSRVLHWNQFVDQLINQSYLVPNNPGASTVAAFYPVDEPELCGLNDTKGLDGWSTQANPTLSDALSTVRWNASTANVPIAAIVSSRYSKPGISGLTFGVRLFNWVGLDNYGANDNEYLAQIGQLKTRIDTNWQRVILVPQAATNAPGLDGWPHTPQVMYDAARADPAVVMLMPFLWFHPQGLGTRDIPWMRAEYTRIGTEIKVAP